jgi:hypothetical protein
MLNKYPPMIATNYTPEQIVGQNNLQALAGHIKHFEANKDKPGRAVNAAMGEMISRLAEHGYYIDGIDKYGSVKFMQAKKGKCQIAFEGVGGERLREFSADEISRMRRNGCDAAVRETTKNLRN